MSTRQLYSVPLLAMLGFALLLPGCGSTLYAININGAARKLEQAKALNAEKLAPYEFYYAEAHFLKAKQEAANADYSDAIELAEVAEQYADQAIKLTKAASAKEP